MKLNDNEKTAATNERINAVRQQAFVNSLRTREPDKVKRMVDSHQRQVANQQRNRDEFRKAVLGGQ